MNGRCMTGNVAEFVLTPIFHHHRQHQQQRQQQQSYGRRPSHSPGFACHVQPLPGYALYDIQFSVVHRGAADVVNDVTLMSRRLVTPQNRHPYSTTDK